VHENLKTRILDAVIYITLGILSTFPLVVTILMGTLLDYTLTSIFWMCLMFTVLTAFIFFNKKTLITSCAVISLAIIFGYAQTFADEWSETITYPVVQMFHNTILFSLGYIDYSPGYSLIIISGIAFLVVLLASISIYWSFSFYPLFFLGATIFIISWSFGFPFEDFYILMFLLAMLVLFVRKLNSASKEKQQRDSNNKLVLFSIPVCAVILAISIYMPKPDITYNREGVAAFFSNPIVSVQDFLHFTFNPKYFSLHTSGFGDSSGRLGGQVRLNRHEVMRVWSDERIYLIGGFMDTYTGDRWLGTFNEFEPYFDNEFGFRAEYAEALKSFLSPHVWGLPGIRDYEDYGFLLALSFISTRDDLYGLAYHQNLDVFTENVFRAAENRGVYFDFDTMMPIYISPDKVPAFLTSNAYISYLNWVEEVEGVAPFKFNNEVTIDIGRMRTGSLFTANRSDRNLEIYWQPEVEIMINGNNTIRSTTVLPQNTRYSFTHTRIDYNNPFIQSILEIAHEGFYSYMLNNHDDLLSSELRVIYEQWEAYAREVRARFTQLPDTLPQRVFDLAKEITEGLTSDFEKAQAVERFLRENFRYSLNVDSLPFGEDFVDYFLFEMDEGYCTYFASAMAILLRCVGIPTRYVVGYLLPSTRVNDDYFLVTGEHAHAWVDVYLEGFGWLPFEPTPPQHYSRIGVTPDFDIFAQDFLDDPWFDEHFDLWGFAMDVAARADRDGDETNIPQSNNQDGFFGTRGDREPLGPIVIAALSALSLAALLLIYKGLKMGLFYIRTNKMPASGQAVAYFDKILKVWAYDGYVKKAHETPANFVNRLPIYNYSVERLQITDSVDIYYKAKFSQNGITPEELENIKITWRMVYADVIKRCEGIKKITGYFKRLFKIW